MSQSYNYNTHNASAQTMLTMAFQVSMGNGEAPSRKQFGTLPANRLGLSAPTEVGSSG